MSERFSKQVLQLLKEAGWFEGRNIVISEDAQVNLQPFAAAVSVLSEFGGLHIGHCGAGIECATSDVEIDPALTTHLSPDLREYERTWNTKLFALGDFQHSHGYLIIDSDGKAYLMNDTLDYFAVSFDQALEKLLLGLLPDVAKTPAL